VRGALGVQRTLMRGGGVLEARVVGVTGTRAALAGARRGPAAGGPKGHQARARVRLRPDPDARGAGGGVGAAPRAVGAPGRGRRGAGAHQGRFTDHFGKR